MMGHIFLVIYSTTKAIGDYVYFIVMKRDVIGKV